MIVPGPTCSEPYGPAPRHISNVAQIVLSLVIGLLAGVLSGMFGIGGGVLIVPALVLVLKFDQLKAQGTSLIALIAPVGALAVWQYWQGKQVDLKIGGLVAAGFVAGGLIGSRVALGAGDALMRRGFAGFLVVLGFYLFFAKS